MQKKHKPLYVYFGHHKCASQWIKAIIRGVCRDMGLILGVVNLYSLGNASLAQFVNTHQIDFLADVNGRSHHLSQLGHFRGFHVVRDPRDICVSAYFSHLYSHPTKFKWTEHLLETRQELQKLSKEDGLQAVIKGRQEQFEAMLQWDYALPHILEVKMEELVQEPYEGFLKIFRHLDLLDETGFSLQKQLAYLSASIFNIAYGRMRRFFPFAAKPQELKPNGRVFSYATPYFLSDASYPAEKLLSHVYANRFSAKAKGRKPGEEDIKSHYRKGVVGDWVNHFTAEHIQYFKEHYNDLLIKLDYERGDDW